MMEFKIVPIRNGTVLDHIEPGRALDILKALGYPIEKSGKVVSVAMNLPSSREPKGGLKDVLKFEDVELTADEVKQVQGISKRGTLSVIRNYEIAKKNRW
ncbi:MAG: aspartate carbamoyltransferase regulatory subunit [bacterium]